MNRLRTDLYPPLPTGTQEEHFADSECFLREIRVRLSDIANSVGLELDYSPEIWDKVPTFSPYDVDEDNGAALYLPTADPRLDFVVCCYHEPSSINSLVGEMITNMQIQFRGRVQNVGVYP